MGQEFKKGDKVRALKDYKSIFTGRAVFVKGEIYEVASVSGNSLGVVEDSVGKGNGWGKEHFELVETAPTLKDLREKALEALDEGYLDKVCFNKTNRERILLFTEAYPMGRFHEETAQEGLDYIESLKFETFIIITQQDIANIKPQAKGVHANGVEFVAKSIELDTMRGMGCIVGYGEEGKAYNARLFLEELKGAIITQRKAIKGNK